jgi:hypothetical protein
MEFLEHEYLHPVKKLLSNELGIGSSKLDDMYTHFSRVYKGEPSELSQDVNSMDPDCLLGFDQSVVQGNCNYGIDLPVWFTEKNSNRKKILILAMDPLRSETTADQQRSTADFNSPFSIHLRTKNNYFPSISLLASTYDLYITDVFKLFYRDKSNQKNMSNQSPDFLTMAVHSELLQKEIALFEPSCVLCLGIHALNGLSKIEKFQPNKSIVSELRNYNFKGIPTFAIPHASGIAARWAKLFMEKNGGNYNTKTYIIDAMKLIEHRL